MLWRAMAKEGKREKRYLPTNKDNQLYDTIRIRMMDTTMTTTTTTMMMVTTGG